MLSECVIPGKSTSAVAVEDIKAVVRIFFASKYSIVMSITSDYLGMLNIMADLYPR